MPSPQRRIGDKGNRDGEAIELLAKPTLHVLGDVYAFINVYSRKLPGITADHFG